MPKRKRSFSPIGYDAIGERYEQIYGANQTQIQAGEWLVRQLSPGSSVLDIGCGTGVPTAKQLSKAGLKVLGIDNSTEMIRLARLNVTSAEFTEMNVKKLRLGERSFDAVVAFFSLLHVEKGLFPKVLAQVCNSLKPQGYFILSMIEGEANAKGKLLGQSLHFTAYPLDQLESVVESAGFEVLQTHAAEFVPRMRNAEPEMQFFLYCRRRSSEP